MQDRNDADVAIREMSPVDEMVLVAKEEPEGKGLRSNLLLWMPLGLQGISEPLDM